MHSLVLGLGNDLIADDAIGIVAARELKARISNRAAVVESSLSGVNLLEIFLGYKRVIIIDAIITGQAAPGTIRRLGLNDLSRIIAPSPHYTGLPEMVAIAKELDLAFPEEVSILAVEVEDPFTIGGGMTPAVEKALPILVEQVVDQLAQWEKRPTGIA